MDAREEEQRQPPPLVMNIIWLPFWLFDLSCCACVLPTNAVVLLTQRVVCSAAFRASSSTVHKCPDRTTYALLWLPRWAVGTLLALPLLLLQPVALIWYVWTASSPDGRISAWVACISTGVGVSLAVLRGNRVFAKKFKWLPGAAVWPYYKNVADSQLDLLAFLSCVLVIGTGFRAKHLYYFVRRSDSRSFRIFVHLQLVVAVGLVLCLPLCFLPVFTIWRLPETYKQLKACRQRRLTRISEAVAKNRDAPKRQHTIDKRLLKELIRPLLQDLWDPCQVLLWQNLGVMLDLPCFLLTLPVFLTCWRSISLAFSLYESPVDHRRVVALSMFCSWLLDLPFAAMAVLLCAAPWRLYFTQLEARRLTSPCAADVRRAILRNFLILVGLDLPTLISAILVGVTGWRIRETARRLRDRGDRPAGFVVIWQGLLVLRDAPFVVLAAPVLLTGWRSKILVTRVSTALTDDRWKAAASETVNWLIDLPFVLMGLLVCATVYRAPALYSRVSVASDAPQRRSAALKQFCCVLLDLPCVLCYCFVAVERWHAPEMRRHLIGVSVADLSWHLQVLSAAFTALRDTPYFACMMLTSAAPWRAWYMYKLLWRADTVAEKRDICVEQLTCALLDVPAAACGLLVLLFVWEAEPLLTVLRRSWARSTAGTSTECHLACFSHFRGTVLHLPFIVLVLLTAPFLWRFSVLILQLRRCASSSEKRKQVLLNSALVLLDIPCILVAVFNLVTVRRGKQLFDDLRTFIVVLGVKDEPLTAWELMWIHKQIARNALCTLADAIFCLLVVTMMLVPWRLALLVRQLWWEPSSSRSRFSLLARHAALGVADIACFTLVVLITFTWRCCSLYRQLAQCSRTVSHIGDTLALHGVVLTQVSEFLLDAAALTAAPALLWRLPCVAIDCFSRSIPAGVRRRLVLSGLVEVLRDLPFLALAPALALAPWRAVFFAQNIRRDWGSSNEHKRELLVDQFVLAVIDALTLLGMACTTAAVWRAPFFWFAVLRSPVQHWHRLTADTLAAVFFDLPYVPCFLVLLLATPWRVPALAWYLAFDQSALEQKRRRVLSLLLLCGKDYACAALACIVTVTVWRSHSLWLRLVRIHAIEGPVSWHGVVVGEFREWSIDLPFVPLAVGTLLFPWRLWFLLRELCFSSLSRTSREKRWLVAEQFALGPADLLAVACCVFVVALVWHAGFLKRDLTTESGFGRHRVAFRLALLTVMDLPFILLCAIALCIPSRAPFIIWDLRKCTTFSDKRYVAVLHFAISLIIEPVALVCCTLVFVTLWRACALWNTTREFVARYRLPAAPLPTFDQATQLHREAIASLIKLLVADLPFFVLLVPCCACPWRLRRVLTLLKVSEQQECQKEQSQKPSACSHFWYRRFVITVFCWYSLVDLLCAPIVLVLLLSWRAPIVFSTLKSNAREAFSRDQPPKKTTRRERTTQAPAPQRRSLVLADSHRFILQQFWSLLVDLVFITASPLLLWRLPHVTYKIFAVETTADARRMLVARQIMETAVDLPYAVFFCLMAGMAPWRVVLTVRGFFRLLGQPDSLKRSCVVHHCLWSFADIVCAAPMVALSFSWRTVSVWRAICSEPASWHASCIRSLMELVKDLPQVPLFLFVASAAFWRLPGLLRGLALPGTDSEKRQLVRCVFVRAVQDYLCAVMLCALICSWRAFGTLRAIISSPHQWKVAIFTQSSDLARDLPYLPLVLVTFLIGPWRVPTLLWALVFDNADSAAKRLRVSATFSLALLDDACCVLATVMTITLWRAYSVWYHVMWPAKPGVSWHRMVLAQFVEWLRDLPYLPFGLLCLFFPWRVPGLFRLLLSSVGYSVKRWGCVCEFGSGLADLPAVTCTLVVTVTLWHAAQLFRDLRAGAYDRWHTVAFRHFHSTLCDSPFIVCALLALLLPWRTVQTVLALYHAQNNAEKREAAAVQLVSAVLDLPCAVMFLAVVCTGFHLPALARKLRAMHQEVTQPRFAFHKMIATEFLLLVLDGSVWIASLLLLWRLPFAALHLYRCDGASARFALFRVLVWETVKDVPHVPAFIVAVTLGMPRLPGLAKSLLSDDLENNTKRDCVDTSAALALLDVLCLFLVAVMFATVWHVRLLWRSRPWTHEVILEHFCQWLREAPYACIAVLTCVLFCWRGVLLAVECWRGSPRPNKIAYHFGRGCADVFCALLLACMLPVTPWRVYFSLADRGGSVDWHRATCNNFGQLPLDVAALFCLLFVTVTLVHAPETWLCLCAPLGSLLRRKSRGEGSINYVSDDALRCIFSHLPPLEALTTCSLVCRRWRSVLVDPALWRSFAQRDFPDEREKIVRGPAGRALQFYLRIYRRHRGARPHTAYARRRQQQPSHRFVFAQARLAIVDLPHTLLLPAKLLAVLLCVPVLGYARWRLDTGVGLTYLSGGAHVTRAWDTLSFWTLHALLFGLPLFPAAVVLNELAFVLSAFNYACMFVLTAGNMPPERLPPCALAALHVMQSAAAPVLLLCQLPLFLLPVAASLVMHSYFPSLSALLPRGWMLAAAQCAWSVLVFPAAESLTLKHWYGRFQAFAPGIVYRAALHVVLEAAAALRVALRRLLARALAAVWRALSFAATAAQALLQLVLAALTLNNRVLANITARCFYWGLTGNLLLVPLCVAWFTWPLVFAVVAAGLRVSALAPAIVATIFLLRQANRLVPLNWGRRPCDPRPRLRLTGFYLINRPELGRTGQTEVRFTADAIAAPPVPAATVTRAKPLVAHAALALYGDAFWRDVATVAGATAARLFRAMFHPVALAPGRTPAAAWDACARGTARTLDCSFVAPVSAATLRAALERLRDLPGGDSELALRVEHGEFVLIEWVRAGVLTDCNTTPSALLRALNTGKNMLHLDDDNAE
eukprot:TRINITY_DN5349_c0_g1_i1.p1 TRINITY_DN5349_c0_g1~~TRINITY_DN5349_c0_g1_i1.p1  ORF type:complete len:2864 (-),score=408.93 TRINITY_DN5349_c0_g1_i1:104-8695(-)